MKLHNSGFLDFWFVHDLDTILPNVAMPNCKSGSRAEYKLSGNINSGYQWHDELVLKLTICKKNLSLHQIISLQINLRLNWANEK